MGNDCYCGIVRQYPQFPASVTISIVFNDFKGLFVKEPYIYH